MNIKSWFCDILAKSYSKKGEHTRALFLSDFKNNSILLNAGMFLTLFERHDVSSGPEYAIALAKVGRLDESLALLKTLSLTKKTKILLGFLAVEFPAEILELVKGKSIFKVIESYCTSVLGRGEFILGKNQFKLHDFQNLMSANRVLEASESFYAFFTALNLTPPFIKFKNKGIDFTSLNEKNNSVISSKKGPLVSVVLTAYNEEKYLELAVGSILNQTWSNLELIIVNDASTDDTNEIIEQLKVRDSRVRSINLPENLGLWKAKNIGLKACTGKFITMHDADDWSHSKKLEIQIEQLIKNRKLLATSSYMIRCDEESGQLFTRNALNYLRWNPSSFMFRAELLVEVGYFREDVLGSDCEFVSRIETMHRRNKHSYIALPLSIGLNRQNSLSNKFRGADDETSIRLKDWEKWRKSHITLL